MKKNSIGAGKNWAEDKAFAGIASVYPGGNIMNGTWKKKLPELMKLPKTAGNKPSGSHTSICLIKSVKTVGNMIFLF